MENNEKQMTGEDSLRIIMDMINRTKVSIRQGSFHLLFWGWLIFLCSTSEYLIWKVFGFAQAYYVWLFVIPGVFVSLIYGYVKGRQEKVFTYATSIYVWAWMAFLCSGVVMFIILTKSIHLFTPAILTLAAIPTFLSGIILRFRPLIIGAVTFWIFALIAHFGGENLSGLSMPAAMLTGYLIPGYLLKRKDHDTI